MVFSLERGNKNQILNTKCQPNFLFLFQIEKRSGQGGQAVLNQIRVVAFNVPQLTQASFLQKNQTLQNVFLISVTLRWHKASVACKNQSF